ncbi:hypothetical protein SESBI_48515 [Sesbania bispinosa]|nr:hypothetical protein SESBI_48515 [Sesbania bispinosa]
MEGEKPENSVNIETGALPVNQKIPSHYGLNETAPAAPMDIITPTAPLAPLGPAPTIPGALEEVQEAEPRETNQLQQGPTAQENDLRVYFRKKKIQEEKGPITSQMQSHDSNQAPENEIPPAPH